VDADRGHNLTKIRQHHTLLKERTVPDTLTPLAKYEVETYGAPNSKRHHDLTRRKGFG
tara:strand:- start:700 stop:873 length:174 start_codon:yes stop_codon:yes gene_type:complete